MVNPFKPISISLSPNTEKDDIFLAFKFLFMPWRWKKGKAQEDLENSFKKYLGAKYAYCFNSGRSSLMAILESLELEKDSEILLQVPTCNAAVNPIRWAGFKPVFVDCDKSYNLSVEDLKKKITPRSRAVMIQHTFGLPADIEAIKKICDEHGLILIEDCAHSLGAELDGRKIGTFGKASFFSFSRDKVISCVYGGMVATNDENLAKKIDTFQKKAGHPSYGWIFQQLLHPVLMNWLILPTYSIFGKYFLVLLQWAHVLSKAIHWKEKRGLRPDYFPKCLSNALAILAQKQLEKVEKFNEHRRGLAKFYRQKLENNEFILPPENKNAKPVYLRFCACCDNASAIIKKAWKKNLLLGDWYRTPVDPFDTKLEKVGYKKGSCPSAEKFSGQMINLPTHINISKKEAGRIIDFLKKEQ